MYDAIIIGGGPAGLSAALILGRCRRRVVVFDAGEPRNAASSGMHGFLSRDGIAPSEFLNMAREQLKPYAVEFRMVHVVNARVVRHGFDVTLDDGERVAGKTLLLATGVVDKLPNIEGVKDLYGRSVFHCPYCDGWELRGQPIAVYGRGKAAVALSLSLKTWTSDVVLCTDGAPRLSAVDQARLLGHDVTVRAERIARLEGIDGVLQRIVFQNGDSLRRRALFFTTGQQQRSPLPAQLGCVFNRRGTVRTNRLEGSGVPGLYVAGDASEDVQLVVIAAAEGAKAAFAINRRLQEQEDLSG